MKKKNHFFFVEQGIKIEGNIVKEFLCATKTANENIANRHLEKKKNVIE